MDAKTLEDMLADTAKSDDEVLEAVKEFTHWPPDPNDTWEPTEQEIAELTRVANIADRLRPNVMDRYLKEVNEVHGDCCGHDSCCGADESNVQNEHCGPNGCGCS